MMMWNRGVAIWFLAAAAAMLTSGVMSRRLDVGGRFGWTQDAEVNYTEWASHNHFYVGDWLYFRFDKHKYNVLEVNTTNYENCNDHEFLKNITRGGRDVFQLTEARPYYFLSSGGYCYHGLKLAINVSLFAPAPAPAKSTAAPTKPAASRSRIALISAAAAAIQALIWFPGL